MPPKKFFIEKKCSLIFLLTHIIFSLKEMGANKDKVLFSFIERRLQKQPAEVLYIKRCS